MKKNILLSIAFGLVIGLASGFSQDKKFEVNGMIGYTLSEGVDVNRQNEDDLGIDRLSPKSAFSFSLGMDYLLSQNFSVGFNFGQEKSTLRADAEGFKGVDVTDMNVNNYHGIFTYNFRDEKESLRPFIFGGFGATGYSPDPISGIKVNGATKFSTTWGGGIKYFTSEHLGFRGGVRWTPTHIKSEFGGLWCSPYWPWDCWVMENAKYSHQFELSVGILARF